MQTLLRQFFAAFIIVALNQPAFAGWYRVDNYRGEVNGKPIQLSLQRYEFGSGITIEGSYFLEAERRPVALYGMLNGERAILCEITSDAELDRIVVRGSKTPFDFSDCPLTLDVTEGQAVGQWKRDGGPEHVSLVHVASLDDRREQNLAGRFVIPFWAQTEAHMFTGTYENFPSGICLSKVEMVRKSTGKVDQTLTYGGEGCTAGMVMTPIYMNIQKWIDGSTAVISVNFKDNAAGFSDDFVYDETLARLVQRP